MVQSLDEIPYGQMPKWGQTDEGKKGLGKYVWSGKDYAVGFVGGTLAVAAVPLVLSSLGFTTTGVAAGSAAAAIQSAVYGGSVTSGSIFAVLQSLGAGGLGMKASSLVYNFGSDMAIYFMKMVAPDEEESKCS
ncbi:Interferon alpha-inducible protein 6 [Stylophora pistillata]|uniref:Interferon alpha-inducible protein 6 n=1 Tax=Stylophora pistillata TaxID=50429 RepID=A0A2B4RTH3_STYPI|nr:Interferon alpha-inducible protein 6 [Stylophora pistillata]